MIHYPTSGAPSVPVSQGATLPPANANFGSYAPPQMFTNVGYLYPGAQNLSQTSTSLGNAGAVQMTNVPAAGAQAVPGNAQPNRVQTPAVMGTAQPPGGDDKKRLVFQQLLALLYQTGSMTKDAVERLVRRGAEMKDDDLMVCLKEAVGNEKLAGALKTLTAGQHRKGPGMPYTNQQQQQQPPPQQQQQQQQQQEGFVQRGAMAGLNHQGIPQQHLTQLQGTMKRPVPPQHGSVALGRQVSDVGPHLVTSGVGPSGHVSLFQGQPPNVHTPNQVYSVPMHPHMGQNTPSQSLATSLQGAPIQRQQEGMIRQTPQVGMNPSHLGNMQQQRPRVVGVASSGPAVGMPLQSTQPRPMSSYPNNPMTHQTSSGLQQMYSTSVMRPSGVLGASQPGLSAGSYSRMGAPMNSDWNRMVVPGDAPKDGSLLHSFPAGGTPSSRSNWPVSAGASAPNGNSYINQVPSAPNMHSVQNPRGLITAQTGEKRPAPPAVEPAQKRPALESDKGGRPGRAPKTKRPHEDPNAPDAAEGDVIQGAEIELADEQEALLGRFMTVRQGEVSQPAKQASAPPSTSSWVNSAAVQDKLNRVLRREGVAGMGPECVEAMVRGIELKFEGMIGKFVSSARHRLPPTAGRRGVQITSDIRGKLREVKKAEAEKQASKERAERAKLEKLAETATQTATKKELAGNKELAAKVEKVKRERLLSAEAAATNRALSRAFGGLGFDKLRKMKREKEAAEKAKEEAKERARRAKEQEKGAQAKQGGSGKEKSRRGKVQGGTRAALSQGGPDKKAKVSVLKIQVKDVLSVLGRDPSYCRSKELQRLYLRKR
ncbi:hypothetical protein BSKO_02110 [Bryopsis sp. KO-2023]|nr:hypothetical protein BSKO_02110 [Bryopsis sp. KO-2023]